MFCTPRRARTWILLALSLLISAPCSSTSAEAPYLIVHLDAVSSSLFFEMYDTGQLPNLKSLMGEGRVIRHAITPFIPGTEILYHRLKNGPDAGPVPAGWVTQNRDTGEFNSYLQNIVSLYSNMPPYTATQGIHAIPGLEWLSGLALMNTPRMLVDYDIVETFWFSTDCLGHTQGEEAQKKSVILLDGFVGMVKRQLNGKDINFVLYCDHGMSFFERSVDPDAAMRDEAGANCLFASYPNLYLTAPEKAPAIAEALAQRDEIDLAFFRASQDAVIGICKQGMFTFTQSPQGISYTHDGYDPFNYGKLDYSSQPLSDQEWLELTCTHEYPAAPVQIMRHMRNPLSGDVVVVLNPPKGLLTLSGPAGCHTGLSSTEVTVPVLLSGPDVSNIDIPDCFWLHTLYADVLKIDPSSPSRAFREPHMLWLSPCGLELALSPSPNLYLRSTAANEGLSAAAEIQLFRTLNARGWAGAGLHSSSNASLEMEFIGRLQIFAGPLSLDWENRFTSEGRRSRIGVRYESPHGVMVEAHWPASLRLGIKW